MQPYGVQPDGPGLTLANRLTTFGRLMEVHTDLTHILVQEMETAVGLPRLACGVLLHLGRSPAGHRAMSELVIATAFTCGGVTRLVHRLERADYVQRYLYPIDCRVQFVALTQAGRNMLERGTEVDLPGV